MKLIDFFKYYYEKTFKSFPDETPYRRGINISKKNRKPCLWFAYIVLCLSFISFPIVIFVSEYWIPICLIIVTLVFLTFVIINEADYNVIKIYRCYKIFNSEDVLSKFLKDTWFGRNYSNLIKNNLNIKGLKHSRMTEGFFSNDFMRKYIIPFENSGKVVLIIKTNKAILQYNGRKKVYKKKYDKITTLFDDIRNDLLKMLESTN